MHVLVPCALKVAMAMVVMMIMALRVLRVVMGRTDRKNKTDI